MGSDLGHCPCKFVKFNIEICADVKPAVSECGLCGMCSGMGAVAQ